MEALKYTSLLGNLALMYTVILVACEWYANPEGDDVEIVALTPASLRVVGIYISSFNFHCNMPIYYRDMQPCTPRRMLPIILAVYAIVLAVYVLVAYCGYALFGHGLHSNLLRNFGHERRFLICRLGLGFMIVTTFPIIVVPTRQALHHLVHGDYPMHWRQQIGLSFAIVAFTCTAAHFVPSFGVVLAYNGALLGTLQQLVFPGLSFYMISRKAGYAGPELLWAQVVVVVGLVLAVIGVACETYALTTGE
eukprot:TRINITY_DN8480_c0_g1_i1.p3 TRINITY_DN8480_c0_g1~~TRINITY_DN8480_c0_g1_i1.p3  ORF type:complete len:250 (-),score=119.04 TRINITY_DN8480_c0_g1_i1:254-1003(-)